MTTYQRPTAPAVDLAARAVVLERARGALADLVRDGAGMEAVRAGQTRADLAEERLHVALAAAVPGYDPGDLARALAAEDEHDHHEEDPR